MGAPDHADEVLRVYPSRTRDGGWWCSAYGDIPGPEGWEFLPAGNAFVTRRVKQLGPHWIAVKKRKDYTETLGLLAPPESVQAARALAAETATRREEAREHSRERRMEKEQSYQEDFAQAVLRFLDFAPRHKMLARKIAQGAAAQATEVGSGRVGRTSKLSLEEKAGLAARAYIRHHYTRYEDHLVQGGLFDLDSFTYRDIRQQAHEEVDVFLETHRAGRRRPR